MRGLSITLLLMIWIAGNCHASDVILQWDPNTEPDLAGYRIYYKANSAELPFDGAGAVEGVAPIDVANQTTATVRGLDPGTDYYFAVTAYNASGMESSYSEIIALPGVRDITPPSVSLASPLSGARVSGAVKLTATATDDTGVRVIELYQQDHLIAAGNTAPFASIWDTSALPDGSYTITAKAYDAAGNIGTTSVTVTVVNDTMAPQINSFILPASVKTLTVPVTLAASDNAGVTGYFVRESSAVPAADAAGWSATAPTSFTFSAYGSHTLYAWAKDAAGNVSQSRSCTVITDNLAPVVSGPSVSSVGGSVAIAASARDNIAVSRMQLYLDGSLLSQTAGGSISYQTKLSRGRHTVTAKAYDAAGNVAARSVTITK